MSKITVIDNLMGAGKTSWAIQYMNENYDDNVLYITPYRDETVRIKDRVQKEIKCPENHGNGKLGDIAKLLSNQEDISSTHALFMKLNAKCKEAIKNGHYTLFLDETINVIEPYDVKCKDDIKYLEKNGSIEIDTEGYINWIDDDLDIQ